MCGGTSGGISPRIKLDGLSPRVRGNHCRPPLCTAQARSIPACAGEPETDVLKVRRHAVYPRVCGGTSRRPGPLLPDAGLSPRVRGNRKELFESIQGAGSIPACAGEPGMDTPRFSPDQVYPRVCGEPTISNSCSRCRRVYPRVCGGTRAFPLDLPYQAGLSPRVRGNLLCDTNPHISNGSIPACAGEPSLMAMVDRGEMVYPRVCGGTLTASRRQTGSRGLSPRVRGNLVGQP